MNPKLSIDIKRPISHGTTPSYSPVKLKKEHKQPLSIQHLAQEQFSFLNSVKYYGTLNTFSKWIYDNIYGKISHDMLMSSFLLVTKELEHSIFNKSECVHLLQIIFTLAKKKWKEGSEKVFLFWLQLIKETLGETIFCLVTNPDSYQDSYNLDDVILLLQKIVEMAADIDGIQPILIEFYEQKIMLKACLEKLDRLKAEIYLTKHPEKDLKEVLAEFGSLQNDSEEEYQTIVQIGLKLQKCGLEDFKTQVKQITKQELTKENRLALIAIGREAIRLTFGIYPYNTQILALLGLLHHSPQLKGRIAQVKTGEGKSILTTLFAFYFACQGKNVDIISSSRYLAQRDQEKYVSFFQLFGISTSHICCDMPTADHFKGQILYGTNHDFEFKFMRHYLASQPKRDERKFEVVIVDEADNLFIDSALNSARIAISSKTQFNWIFPLILNFVSQHTQQIKPIVENYSDQKMKALTEQLKNDLISQQIPPETINCIKENQFAKWILSAYQALINLHLDEDYVIKPIEERTEESCQNQITIIDKQNTGRLQEASRWQDGIHEFLEAKHDLPIKTQGITVAALCHSVYLNYYPHIYGLTGTLGTTREKKEIAELYRIDSIEVPSHRKSLLQTIQTQILFSQQDHLQAIIDEIILIKEQKRPTLVLFKTIADTRNFSIRLNQEGIFHQLMNERQKEHEHFLIARAGNLGMVTIATNTAGRGTDIILHPDSRGYGGLHVIFTFYPANERVEAQGFGRAARQGDPGSARLILCMLNTSFLHALLPEKIVSDQQIFLLKETRDYHNNLLSQQRQERAAIETLNHRYLKEFFDNFKAWQETLNEDFFQEIISKCREKHVEAKIKEKNLIYLLEYSAPHEAWLNFFKQVKQCLILEIQQAWAEGFFNCLDDLYTLAKKQHNSSQEILDAYSQQLDKLYQENCSRWQHFLKDSKKTFYEYLWRVDSVE